MEKYVLKDLISVKRGMSLSGEYYSTEGDLIRLTLGNFQEEGGFKINTSKDDLYFTGPVKDEFILAEGDIITPLTEQVVGLLGATARIPESGKYIQSGDVALIKCISDKIDDGYCYYLISSDVVRKQLSAAAQQTKIRHTSPEKIMDCEVFIPEVKEQRKVAKLLDGINKKIELNNKINDNLYEQLTLFCSHISASSAAERHTLSDFCSYTSQKIDSSELNQNDYVSTDNLLPEKQGITIAKNLPAVGSATLCHNADILVSNIRPYLKKIYYCQRKMGCSSDVLNIRTTKEDLAPFIYFCLRQDAFFAHMMAGSKGTKMPRGDKNQIMRYTIMMPPTDLMEQFIKLARPTMLQIKHNEDDNNNLLRIRNYLLPLLMSGQATIAD